MKVPINMFLLALIPIPYVYLLNIILSAVLGGIVFGSVLSVSFTKGLTLILSSFPHMFIELSAFSIWGASIYSLNLWIRNKLFKRKNTTSFIFELKNCVKHYMTLVIPLIVLAAFLETFIADIILSLFS